MTHAWAEVCAFYAEIDAAAADAPGGSPFAAVRRLAEELATWPGAAALHPWTSMHDLHLSQLPPSYPRTEPYLRIRPLAGGRLELRYVDTGLADRQWARAVPSDAALARVLRAFEELHWFERIPVQEP